MSAFTARSASRLLKAKRRQAAATSGCSGELGPFTHPPTSGMLYTCACSSSSSSKWVLVQQGGWIICAMTAECTEVQMCAPRHLTRVQACFYLHSIKRATAAHGRHHSRRSPPSCHSVQVYHSHAWPAHIDVCCLQRQEAPGLVHAQETALQRDTHKQHSDVITTTGAECIIRSCHCRHTLCLVEVQETHGRSEASSVAANV